MPIIIDYIAKLSLALAVVYIFYVLLLRRLTFYNWNRWYLLGYTALSFIIPLINIMPELKRKELDKTNLLTWIPSMGVEHLTEEKSFFQNVGLWDWALMLFFTGSLLLLIKFLFKFYSFKKMKNSARLISGELTKIYQLDADIAPFSFGNAIFINKKKYTDEELQEIIRHEFVHIKQKHTLDIIWCELLCIINWMNPFVWLLRKAIKQNLEFIADDKVLQHGYDKSEYQYLLLKVMGNRQFAFTNHFNFSSLKNRIIMMNTIKSAKIHLAKFLFLLPVIAVLLLAFRREVKEKMMTSLQDLVPTALILNKDTIPPGTVNKPVNNKNQFAPVEIKIRNEDGRRGDKPRINERPLVVVDNEIISEEEMSKIAPDQIKEISVYKDKYATDKYGEKGKDGVIEIKLKSVNSQPDYNKEGPSSKNQNIVDDLKIRGLKGRPLFVLNEKVVSADEVSKISPEDIESVSVLKDKYATDKYGEAGKNGVIEIRLKLVNGASSYSIDASNSKTLKPEISKRLRGTPSHENPLYVIDNRLSSKGELSKISPDDIESISVLKDKSATSKYGDLAANGVIEITTKDGKVMAYDKSNGVTILADSIYIKMNK
ncbi:MAG TPA: TonB-dependent receptor plug domain-containing protein [Niabella sp.]|nr:TonB-dependent receptor plug domain-containing protein [Chitinophagaceae bacterium]HRN47365.1 TonB-dependent receptor plug domain-containing protein [Niabella sp.]HRO84081.1 TonB-dependent receptor plug domain-containing protein [Niabella sp.]